MSKSRSSPLPSIAGHVDIPAGHLVGGPNSYTLDLEASFGIKWRPMAMRFFTAFPNLTDGYTVAEQRLSAGMAVINSGQMCLGCGARELAHVAGFSAQTAGTNAYDTQVTTLISTADDEIAPDISLTISSWDCHGVTFQYDFGAGNTPAFRLYFVAYSSITLKAACGSLVLPSDGSGAIVSGLGFQPEMIDFLTYPGYINDDYPTLRPTRAARFAAGVATASFQGYARATGFNTLALPAYGGEFALGTGKISEEATVSSIDSGGFHLTGSPSVDLTVMWMALKDANGGFWAGHTAWPTSSTDFTTSFDPEIVMALMAGGVNGDGYARCGVGALDADGDGGCVLSQWAVASTANAGRGSAEESDGPIAVLYDTSGTRLGDQALTIGTNKFTLAGSSFGGYGTADLILSAVRVGPQPLVCPTVVSASPNKYAHQRIGVTTVRA